MRGYHILSNNIFAQLTQLMLLSSFQTLKSNFKITHTYYTLYTSFTAYIRYINTYLHISYIQYIIFTPYNISYIFLLSKFCLYSFLTWIFTLTLYFQNWTIQGYLRYFYCNLSFSRYITIKSSQYLKFSNNLLEKPY